MLLRDGVSHHPKVVAAGAEAAWLWVSAIDYARAHLTNGYIPADILPMLGRFRTRVHRLADQLVAAGLFTQVDGGYTIHDFLDHNDSREEVLEKRRQDRARKTGRPRGGTATDSNGNPNGIPLDREASRARGSALAVALDSAPACSSSEGEREREAPTPFRVLDDYWQTWREAAASAGTDIRLGASATEREHLRELAAAYTVEDFATACQVFWASRYLPSRALGLLRSLMADLLAHAASGNRRAFRAPVERRDTARPAASYRSHAEWHCGHEPHCANRRQCELLVTLEAERAAKQEAS